MFKRNHINVAIAATALLASSAAFAETVTSTATVTVQNAFTLAEVVPLNFGSLRVTQPGAQATATPTFITLPVDGSAMIATDGNASASMTAITQGTIAEYAISNAAPFTNLSVTLDASGTNELTATIATSIAGVNGATLVTAGGAADEFFTIHADVSDTLIVGGANDGDPLVTAANNLRTDGTGAVGLQLGAVLSYNAAASGSPNDGLFQGSYTLEVTY
ncbi:MAG: hypothetical protein ACJAYN_002150 [Bermanella sp.]|jgi:hypothetical protein|uniref:hypothetical protein n=1 Tax=Glaciecola sp. 33A TaxID=2057807 RepID=UPI000C31D7A7|nr:hypothetical protein [Glaciecola sp. 33A]PKH99809.1 hypothetical protein CXF81_16570 [Glaciecola sp. 33A]